MQSTRLILLAEEDAATRTFLADNLTADGYTVLAAADRPTALALLESERPHLVVCDVNGDTLELLDAVRNADGLASRIKPDTPLIVLTSGADELARVRFLDRGCDDVISKPFSYLELRARIRSVLHRVYDRASGSGLLRVGPITIDPVGRQVHLDGERIAVSNKEFALLRTLASDPTRVWTKQELLRDLWGFRAMGVTRTLDSHACRLRHKLGIHGGRFVINVWGVGYRLIDGPMHPADERAPADGSTAPAISAAAA
jgi:DNA-binding response OmpR family regulator